MIEVNLVLFSVMVVISLAVASVIVGYIGAVAGFRIAEGEWPKFEGDE